MDISKYIPFGKENAISRSELCALTGFSDRLNRKYVEEARQAGKFIIPSENGGYYQTNNPKEMEQFLKTIDARINSMYFTYLPMRKAVNEAKGIKITKVRQHLRRLGLGNCEGQQRIEVM